MMRSAEKVENVELGITLTYGSSQSKDKDNNRSERRKNASFYLPGLKILLNFYPILLFPGLVFV